MELSGLRMMCGAPGWADDGFYRDEVDEAIHVRLQAANYCQVRNRDDRGGRRTSSRFAIGRVMKSAVNYSGGHFLDALIFCEWGLLKIY
jgi:hypothetical protein